MPFVVRSAGQGFGDTWLAPKSDIGAYTLGPRDVAVVFPTQDEAHAAIVEAATYMGRIGLVFTVESDSPRSVGN